MIEGAAVFSATSSKADYLCLEQESKVIAGKLMNKGKKFLPYREMKSKQILKLKLKLKAEVLITKKTKFKNKIKFIKSTINTALTACAAESERRKLPEIECKISLINSDISLTENEVREIEIASTANCSSELNFSVNSPAQHGSAYMDAGKLFYKAGYGNFADSFTIMACHESPHVCSSPATINITSFGSDFVGRVDKLEKYRNKISYKEARHLINKLALNDFSILSDDLKLEDGYNLEAIVNKLLDPYLVSADLKEQLQIFRDGGIIKDGVTPSIMRPLPDAWGRRFFQASTPLESALDQYKAFESFQHEFFKGYNPNIDVLHYGGNYTSHAVLASSKYLSPTWELLTNIWYGHFGTALHDFNGDYDGYYVRNYMDIISKNALGNFKTMMLGVNPKNCLSQTVESISPDTNPPDRGVLCDAASQAWLSNHENTYYSKNQNFARELMELYLLGPNDLVTGNPNYSEQDVVAATGYMSGYKKITYQSTRNYSLDPQRVITREEIVWDPARHDFTEYTAFKGMPFEISGSVDPVKFVEHIFDNHPGLPRFIAGKLFRMLIYTNPSDEMLAALAARFKQSDFSIADLIYSIATSEAMFSEAAYQPTCIKSPLVTISETLRNFEIPLYGNNVHQSPTAHIFNSTLSSNSRMATALSKLGERPLMYDTVFSYKYCGRNPNQIGEDWLSAQYLLQRTKTLIDHITYAGWSNNSYFHFTDIFEKIPEAAESIYNITPSVIIKYYNKVYNIELSESEYDIIYKYLTSKLDDSDVAAPYGWNPSDKQLMNEKLAGLTTIYASMSQTNIN